MPAYNSSEFRPPAPIAHVEIKNLVTGAIEANVPMLIDTGADVTTVPKWIVDRLGVTLEQDSGYEVSGFGDAINVLPAVQLEMAFCRKRFRGRYLVVTQSWGILGRNVLNLVSIVLDGPNLSWREQRST